MTGGHLGAAALAEYDEVLLPPHQAEQVRAHLAGCDECSAVHANLGALAGRLRDAPERLPVPDDVIARIDAALAAERRVPQAVVRLQPRRPLLRRMPQLLGAAAAIGGIVFVGYVGIGGNAGGGDDSGAATTAEAPESASDEAAGDDSAALPEPLSAPAKASLDDQVRAVAAAGPTEASQGEDTDDGAEFRADCGQGLAREVGRDLIGSAATDVGGVGNVLVVVAGAGAGSAQGWVLPTCDATTAEALAEHTVRLD